MLIADELYKSAVAVQRAVIELFAVAEQSQTNPHDILLIDQNAHISSVTGGPTIGHNSILHAYICQHQYICDYRTSQRKGTLVDFLSAVATDSKLQQEEYQSIHSELLLYQKFWELDHLQWILSQFALLVRGRPFEWNLPPDPDALRALRNAKSHLRKPCPQIHAIIDATYDNDIRNAIAHSTFHFVGRRIQFLNRLGNRTRLISFEEWRAIIQNVLHLHNELYGRLQQCEGFYRDKASRTGGRLCIRLGSDVDYTRIAYIQPAARHFWQWSQC